MSNEQQRPDMRHLWQSQVDENTPMSLDGLRDRLSKLHRIILTRTFVAGLGCLIYTVFGVLIFAAPTHTRDTRVAGCIFLIGAGSCLWWVILNLRRVREKWLTEGMPEACAAFYRSELERRRNFFRRAAVLVPLGFSALWVFGFWGLLAMPPLRVIMIVTWVLFVPFWIWHSVESARRSQRELDQLNASFR